MMNFSESSQITDAGLETPEVGAWAEEKYSLVNNYVKMFTSSMKGKWNCLVYIDLFAGAGRSIIRGTNKIVLASPLLALETRNTFGKYIFCEENEGKITTLKSRVSFSYPHANAEFISGDANNVIDKIINEIPRPRKGFKVLSFCFIDPYNLKNLNFMTIKKLSRLFMDFLILLPTNMDAHRNISYYIKSGNGLPPF